eukprot:CAMPEP_0172838078 /NCGR_PEP_ID=MMETSP1075-20121228/27632_1 /TAXON_ID=2916 /ORGANISM="Ceratium fusus, Strain PA161109" /LENGTH=87 /DNA_ID=CAMNT_0013681543 /DNA_START=20 /DNA_END=279 /DNA_ORIENTATION=-
MQFHAWLQFAEYADSIVVALKSVGPLALHLQNMRHPDHCRSWSWPTRRCKLTNAEDAPCDTPSSARAICAEPGFIPPCPTPPTLSTT